MNWINVRTIITSLVAAIVAGTSVYFVQQREIDRLRGENQSILAQQAELSKERDAALLTATSSRDELERLKKDKAELIRLRGEVGLLRKQTGETEKLKEANRQLSASVAQANQDSQQREAEAEVEQKRFAIAKMGDAKLLVLAMLMYANDNSDQIPTDLNLVSNYLAGVEKQLTMTNQFELVIQGSLKNVANPSTTIAVRDREIIVLPDGRRRRAYGFVDGHSELKTEPPEGFDAWEKAHMLPPQQ